MPPRGLDVEVEDEFHPLPPIRDLLTRRRRGHESATESPEREYYRFVCVCVIYLSALIKEN